MLSVEKWCSLHQWSLQVSQAALLAACACIPTRDNLDNHAADLPGPLAAEAM